MNVEYKDLDILVKYISNRVSYTEFENMMMNRYNDKNYIESLWPQFRDNPLMFIVARNEIELFNNILKEINEKNYKG